MDDEYLDMTIRQLRDEVLVKGPEMVADEMGISEKCVRQLCPNESIRYDVSWEKALDDLWNDLDLSDPDDTDN